MKYQIFVALHEESNNGWVWLSSPDLKPRTLIKLYNASTRRSVVCECRIVDPNFLNLYNERPHTSKITDDIGRSRMVISDWYRRALGIEQNQTQAEISVRPLRTWGLGVVRAGSQHPDPIVRLATGLGALALWLSFTSLLLTLAPIVSQKLIPIAGTSAVILGLITLMACKGVQR